jgi:hypothetical protein
MPRRLRLNHVRVDGVEQRARDLVEVAAGESRLATHAQCSEAKPGTL